MPPPNESDFSLSLFDVNKKLRELESSGGKAALYLRDCRVEFEHKRHALRLAKAKATLEAKGTVQVKEAIVDIATDQEQFEAALAKVQVQYAADCVNERSEKRSSLQTQSKLIIEAMRLAGFGGGA